MKQKISNVNLVFAIIFFIIIFTRLFVVAPLKVSGLSMYSTYDDGDVLILNKMAYMWSPIERFDVVVINYEDELIIKRVIGLPGDKLEYKENKLYINDELIEENYLDEYEYTEDYLVDKLDADCYIVLGDNRDISRDSREFGVIKEKQIVGSVIMKLFHMK